MVRKATAETAEVKRLNVITPVKLHNAFKAATAAQGLEMSPVLLAFMQDYVKKHAVTVRQPRKRGK